MHVIAYHEYMLILTYLHDHTHVITYRNDV